MSQTATDDLMAAILSVEQAAPSSRPPARHAAGRPAARRRRAPAGASVGEVVAVDDSGFVLVSVGGRAVATPPVRARSTVPVSAADVGRPAVLVFENADPASPIILGLLVRPGAAPAAAATAPGGGGGKRAAAKSRARDAAVSVDADGQRLVLTAEQEVTLRCGKASITLTRAGKVLLRGAYVLNQSTGVNRIQGGSVEIN